MMLEVHNLNKSYNKRPVLKNLSLTVNKGEVTCLIGHNRSGKTTLMNAIMHLIPYESGSVTLDGKPLTVDDFNRISYVPDQIIMLKQMFIQEALDYMATYYTSFSARKAAELLEFFQLNREQRISQLSKGNLAKLNLLLGMSLETEYILMDEPFSGIDLLTREQIAQVFTTELLNGRGVLISTHEINDIEHLIDKVVLLQSGSVVREFYPEDVRAEEGKSILDVMREEYSK